MRVLVNGNLIFEAPFSSLDTFKDLFSILRKYENGLLYGSLYPPIGFKVSDGIPLDHNGTFQNVIAHRNTLDQLTEYHVIYSAVSGW